MKHGVNGKSVGKWIVIGCLFGVLGTGCVAQKADLQKVHKDLDQQIRQIRVEKKELSKELEAARAAIAKSQKLISAQKADMNKMRSDLAPLNQQIKLLREQDLTSLYGNFEDVEKKISDLRQDLNRQTEQAGSDFQTLQTTVQALEEQQKVTQTQVEVLAQQMDENNQVINEGITDLQKAFTLSMQPKDPTLTEAETTRLLDTMTQLRDSLKNEKVELGELINENRLRLDKLSEEISKLKATPD